MGWDSETIDFGPCCSCGGEGEEINVRNLVMLEKKAPQSSTPPGWGCVQCGLPPVGAVAVLCDDCVSLGRPIQFAIAGWIKEKQRVPIADLGAEHKHDMSKHPGD